MITEVTLLSGLGSRAERYDTLKNGVGRWGVKLVERIPRDLPAKKARGTIVERAAAATEVKPISCPY